MVKGRQGERVRLYVHGTILGYKSFSDEGIESIPQSWKGICQPGVYFNSSHCNRKLIGARYYLKGYEAHYGPLNQTLDFHSARDRDGHGTHTASTVAGREVVLGGLANGTAAGRAHLARLAIYKVCWAIPGQSTIFQSTCPGEDILAAFDDDAIRGLAGELCGGCCGLKMGIYLSSPKTEKFSDDGENNRLRFGLLSMQGWRATMEDAHAAVPDLDTSTSFFGVSDGHGGKVVAKFCAKYLHQQVLNNEAYLAGDIGTSVQKAFSGWMR